MRKWKNHGRVFMGQATRRWPQAVVYLSHNGHRFCRLRRLFVAQKEIASDLFHSRSEVDLRAMQRNGDDWENREEEQFRLESLRAWDRQAIVCTVDTVLGLLQTQRRPLFSFPVIAAGAFVFDEIHSYNAQLFGELLRFLETFPGVPVLLMSASIPPRRLEELKRVLGDRVRQT